MAAKQLACSECGHRSIRWMGRCPDCKAWESFVPVGGSATPAVVGTPAVVAISEVQTGSIERITTGLGEFDRVLGGGLVPGSVVLLAGEPGVGKSTLLLQAAAGIERSGSRVLVVCGEESLEQVAARARRLGGPESIGLTATTAVEALVPLLSQADVVMVDSIQTMRAAESTAEAGSVSQVRLSATALTAAARAEGTAVVLVGHICKDGSIGGPRALEHLVDAVITFEGDRGHVLRTVRSVKNRFGAAAEMGVFEMGAKGLSEVSDASRFFLAERSGSVAGSAVGCVLEGRRPVAIEVQALVVRTSAGFPRRVAQGIDSSRLGVALAILQRRAGVDLSGHDVYVSIAGGLRATEPGIDLALLLALASAAADKALPVDLAAVGEVGLGGEVRSVAGMQARATELARLGFNRIMTPAAGFEPRGADAGPGHRTAVRTINQALACTEC